MRNVVLMSDRFLDRFSPEGIDRQEKLFSCIALISIFYLMLSIAFVKLGALEQKPRAFLADPNVVFELMVAPPEVKAPLLVPPAPAFDEGKSHIGGAPATATAARCGIGQEGGRGALG